MLLVAWLLVAVEAYPAKPGTGPSAVTQPIGALADAHNARQTMQQLDSHVLAKPSGSVATRRGGRGERSALDAILSNLEFVASRDVGSGQLIEFRYEGVDVLVLTDAAGTVSQVSLAGIRVSRVSHAAGGHDEPKYLAARAEYVSVQIDGVVESVLVERAGESASIEFSRPIPPMGSTEMALKRTRSQDACVSAAHAQYAEDMNTCQMIYDLATGGLGFTTGAWLTGCSGPHFPVCGPVTGGGAVIAYAIIRWQFDRCKQQALADFLVRATNCQ